MLVVAGFTLQVFWEALLWSTIIRFPATDRPADFSSFYTAGRLAAAGSYPLLYNLQAELKVQEELAGRSFPIDQLLTFDHPPLLVPLLQLLCSTDYLASYWRWEAVMLGFLALSSLVLNRLLKDAGWGTGQRAFFIPALMLFYPLFASLLKGQDTAFLLLAGIVWLFGLFRRNDPAAGLGLAMMVIRPQIALVLAAPFFFKRRRVWWWFCAGAGLLLLYSLLLVHVQGLKDFVTIIELSSRTQGYGMFQDKMFNFTGLVLRLFPTLSLALVESLAWGLLLAAMIGLSILWKLTPGIRIWHLVLACCVSVFVSPHLHYHDLAFLILPLVGIGLLLGSWQRSGSPERAALLPLAVSLALLLADLWDPLRFSLPYLLMLALPVMAWYFEMRAGARCGLELPAA
jgi:hypothetical protein